MLFKYLDLKYLMCLAYYLLFVLSTSKKKKKKGREKSFFCVQLSKKKSKTMGFFGAFQTQAQNVTGRLKMQSTSTIEATILGSINSRKSFDPLEIRG